MAQQARRAENAQSENLEETNKKPIFTEKETSYERRNGLPQAEIEVSLSEQEASVFMEVMGANAVEQPIIELNSSNWIQQFGADGKVSTPLGEVKMGNNQIAKLFEKGRNEQFGMIKPTLETPLAVIEVPSEATEQETERASSLLFVKTFLGKNGERVYYFKSVTVKKDGMEVSVSSHYDRPKRIKEALKNGKLLYRFDGGAQTEHRPADTSVAASRNEEQGLSDSKDSDIPSKKQNPGGNGLSPDDAGNGRTADAGGRGTEQGTGRGIGPDGNGRGSRDSRRSGQISANPAIRESNKAVRTGMTREEALSIVASMEELAEVAPELVLTPENWVIEFGEDGIVNTPIGEVKMGNHQYAKMMRQNRNGKLGMVKPTLENPDIIVEDISEAKDGDITERGSSYVFVKAFIKLDGSRYYYFTSVTIRKDGHEVVVSNQEKRRNVLTNLLVNGKLAWKHADNVSVASDVANGLYSSQGNVSDPAIEGTDAPQTNYSENKDSK